MTGLNWFRWLAALLAAAGVQAADIRVAVFDFTTIDIQGQKFYEFRDRGPDEKNHDSLSDADRAVIDDRMLGMVKMIDADLAAYKIVHDINRNDQENDRDRARRDELADRILRDGKSVRRPFLRHPAADNGSGENQSVAFLSSIS